MCTPADIFCPLFRLNARNFIIAHSHPSDDTNPSKEDVIFTNKIAKAADIVGLNFLDHIIFGTEAYYSFKQNGII